MSEMAETTVHGYPIVGEQDYRKLTAKALTRVGYCTLFYVHARTTYFKSSESRGSVLVCSTLEHLLLRAEDVHNMFCVSYIDH